MARSDSSSYFRRSSVFWMLVVTVSVSFFTDTLKPGFTVTSSTVPSSSSSPSFPITNYLPPAGGNGAKSAGVMQLPAGFTFMSGSPFGPGTPLGQLQQHSLTLQSSSGQSITGSSSGVSQGQQAVFRLPATVSLTGGTMQQQLQTIQVQSSGQSGCISTSSSEISHSSTASTATVSLVTSSVPTSMTGHMMYPSPHTLMYASAPTLADGSVAVLNAFTQGQVSHTPTQDTGGVPQVFLTAPPGTVQIPVSAVQLHPMVIGQQSSGSSSSLSELQVINLDASQNAKHD